MEYGRFSPLRASLESKLNDCVLERLHLIDRHDVGKELQSVCVGLIGKSNSRFWWLEIPNSQAGVLPVPSERRTPYYGISALITPFSAPTYLKVIF